MDSCKGAMRFPILQAILINSEQFIVRREKIKKGKKKC